MANGITGLPQMSVSLSEMQEFPGQGIGIAFLIYFTLNLLFSFMKNV